MIITSTQYRRPEYTYEMIKHLKNCIGIEECKIIFSVDYYSSYQTDFIYDMLSEINFCDIEININKPALGCNGNTKKALETGFRYDDFVVHVEDDILLSPHSLEIFAELRNKREDNTFSISLYNRLNKQDITEEEYGVVLKRPLFVPWGFGLWSHRYSLIEDCFTNSPDPAKYASWDVQVAKRCYDMNLQHIYTKLSRVDNIGAENGVHVPNPEWHELNHRVPFWADMITDDSPLRCEL